MGRFDELIHEIRTICVAPSVHSKALISLGCPHRPDGDPLLGEVPSGCLKPFTKPHFPLSVVGCAMNCQFCYTGRMGLLGNLTTAQIVEQV